MRIHGTLVKWNDERGFGFIQPSTGTDELFVHISAFPRDGARPRIGEMVSFEVDLREDGKKRAVRLMRPGGTTASRHRPERHRATSPRQRPTSVSIGWIGLLLLGVVGYVGYTKLTSHHWANVANTTISDAAHVSKAMPSKVEISSPANTPPQVQALKAIPAKVDVPARANTSPPAHVFKAIPARVALPTATFHCDGRKYCSQMTSCAEATYFLTRCPGTHMDGDHDGVACERQWCSGG